MSAAMLTSAEGAIAKLALVFLLRGRGLFGRRVVGRRGGRGHFWRRCTNDREDQGFLLSMVARTRRNAVLSGLRIHTGSDGVWTTKVQIAV